MTASDLNKVLDAMNSVGESADATESMLDAGKALVDKTGRRGGKRAMGKVMSDAVKQAMKNGVLPNVRNHRPQ